MHSINFGRIFFSISQLIKIQCIYFRITGYLTCKYCGKLFLFELAKTKLYFLLCCINTLINNWRLMFLDSDLFSVSVITFRFN